MAHIVIPVSVGGSLAALDTPAAVNNVMTPKEFYDDTGTKRVGTMPVGDATADEITRGKKAIVNSVELTGTRPPDYWQYLTCPATSPKFSASLSGAVEMNLSACVRLDNTFDDKDGITSLKLTLTSATTSMSQTFRNNSGLTSVEFVGNSSGVTNFSESFYADTALTTITNIDATACTNFTSWLHNCTSLTTLTMVPQKVNAALPCPTASALNAASLVNIANALKQQASPLTLTLHATAKAIWDGIRGTISGSSGAWVFTDDDGTDTLATFVDADHKNWTVV